MLTEIRRLFKSRFIKNIVLLASGTAGAQALTMLASPIITRLYGPEAFGVMGTFSAITNIIVPVAALTYPVAIVLPKRTDEAKQIVRLSIIITIFISLLVFIFLFIFKNSVVDVFNLQQISSYLFLIPVTILFAGIMQTARQWLIRTNQFSINARAVFVQSFIINISKIGIGIISPIATVLVILSALGDGIRAFIMIKLSDFPRYLLRNPFKGDKKRLLKLAKRYSDFPMFRAPESLVTGISHSMPILFLTMFFGPASAGFFSIGRTVLNLPTRLIGEAVGDVFYPKIAEIYNKNQKITSHILKATGVLALIGVIPFGIVILFGPDLFSFVFGSDWVTAGEYARWIALWSYSNLINRPSTRAIAVLNALRYHLMYTVFGLLIRILVLIIGFVVFENDLIAVALFGIAGFLLNIGLISISIFFSKRR